MPDPRAHQDAKAVNSGINFLFAALLGLLLAAGIAAWSAFKDFEEGRHVRGTCKLAALALAAFGLQQACDPTVQPSPKPPIQKTREEVLESIEAFEKKAGSARDRVLEKWRQERQ